VIHLFTGFDKREAVGLHVFVQSVLEHASEPVSITPLSGRLTKRKDGSNAFTFARFSVPELMEHRGWALFMDGADMVCRADIAELWAMRDARKAVQVVKHYYMTRNPVKDLGTSMECENRDYDRKQWASVMLMRCDHPAWKRVGDTLSTLQLRMFEDDEIGELPIEWNWLADEHGANEAAKVLHFTCGIPKLERYRDTPQADVWFDYHERATEVTG
jgi:hypothetical protein